jgi:hypothetical protein
MAKFAQVLPKLQVSINETSMCDFTIEKAKRGRKERERREKDRKYTYIYEQKTHEFSGLQATQVAKNGLAQAG